MYKGKGVKRASFDVNKMVSHLEPFKQDPVKPELMQEGILAPRPKKEVKRFDLTTLPPERKGKKKDELTIKQRKFIKALIKTGSKKEAALRAFDIKRTNPSNLAEEVLRKPKVKKAFQQALEDAGLDDETLATKLREATEVGWGEKASHKDALRGLELVAKIKGLIGNTSHLRVNINAKAKDMQHEQLQGEFARVRGLNDKLAAKAKIVPGEIVNDSTNSPGPVPPAQ